MTLAPAFAGARPLAKVDRLVDEFLDPESLGQRRREHDPRVGDRPLVVKRDRDAVQSDRPVSMHHEGDLLLQPPDASTSGKRCSEGHFVHVRTDHDSPLTPLNANWRLNETLAYLTHLEATGRSERLPGEPERWRSTIA